MHGIGSKYSLSAASIAFAVLMGSSAQAALMISSDATSNVSCSAGVCMATAADAVLNVTDLTNMLAAGSLAVQSGDQAQDILVEAPFSWTSANALTLDSYRKITVDRPVSDAGPAALNIAYDDGGTGGELLFRTKGRISFTSTKNKLAINGQGFKLIEDIASLASAIANKPSGFYALKDNYNAAKDGTYNFTPIQTHFDGIFEGLGNAISNLSINCERDRHHIGISLIAWLDTSGAIKSVRMKNISYTVQTGNAGGIGGLVSLSLGSLFDDHASGTISAKVSAGGLAGFSGGIISTSSSNVMISTFADAGGLAAGNRGSIIASFSTTDIKHGGGLVSDNDQGTITQSYATGKVGAGSHAPGGLVSLNEVDAAISQSYSTGKVPPNGLVGGFVGEADSRNFTNNYWDIQTSGASQGTSEGNMAGITGLTSKKFKSGLPDGFDPAVWAQDAKINNGYPYLIDNPPAE